MNDPIQLHWLDSRLSKLNVALSRALYFAFTLTADRDQNVLVDTQSVWIGWDDLQRRREIRRPRTVRADFMQRYWSNTGQPYAIINKAHELPLFLICGGNALIEKGVAEGNIPEFLLPDVVVRHGPTGFRSVTTFDPTAFKKAPTQKLRMKVLCRDGRRCRICGRNPDDHLDLELHVHHIRPWMNGGLTDPENLITLCQTCHKGLDPHEDATLFNYIRPPRGSHDLSLRETLLAGITQYRNVIRDHAIPQPSSPP